MNKTRFRKIILTILIVFSSFITKGQHQLQPIDSLYLTTVGDFYKKAENVKSEIWQGMNLAPICLYRISGPAILYNHPSPPSEFKKVSDSIFIGKQKNLNLFGATQVYINGVLTAIVDYGLERYSCKEEVYAELFHELHHVYQRKFFKQVKHDNPSVLLRYPENPQNDALKLYEQEILFKLCFEVDSNRFNALLNQFYSSRLKREQVIGNFINYEKTVENLEGPAFYCEYKFYSQHLSVDESIKENYREKHFFGPLTAPFYGRNSLRHRHLAAGMAICHILDKHHVNWQKEYYHSESSLYDLFVLKFNPQKVELDMHAAYYQLSKFHTQKETIKHQKSYHNFSNQQGTKISLYFNQPPNFDGFDPMHAESINDSTILHHTYLKLSGTGENKLSINNGNVVTKIDNKIWLVNRVILYANEEDIHITDNRLDIDVDGTSVSWSGEIEKNAEDEVIISCND